MRDMKTIFTGAIAGVLLAIAAYAVLVVFFVEADHVVRLDVIAAHDPGDAGHFRGGGEGRQRELDLRLRALGVGLGEDAGVTANDDAEVIVTRHATLAGGSLTAFNPRDVFEATAGKSTTNL